jgi:hypothetical protein
MSAPPSYLDASAYNALSLGGTVIVRDLLVDGKPEVKDAAVAAVAQYAYLKWGGTTLSGWLAGLTGEQMVSGLAANAVGLGAVLLALEATGLVKKSSVAIDDDSGVVPKMKGKSMSKKVVNALVQSTELLIEQQLLLKLSGMAGVSLPTGQPGPALTK